MSALDGAQARELEPALSDAVGCAYHTTVDRYVQPQSLMAGLAARLREQGVAIREGAAVTAARAGRARRWRLSLEGGEVVEAGSVVIAAGAATHGAAGAARRAAPADRRQGVLGRSARATARRPGSRST